MTSVPGWLGRVRPDGVTVMIPDPGQRVDDSLRVDVDPPARTPMLHPLTAAFWRPVAPIASVFSTKNPESCP